MSLNKKPVTGMKDILPAEMQLRDYCINVIKETYGKFGFTSIETPCVESIGNLNSKQGGENEKLIFKILSILPEGFIGGVVVCSRIAFCQHIAQTLFVNQCSHLGK